MKRVASLILSVLLLSVALPAAAAPVDPNVDAHRVVGGLYALSAAAGLNTKAAPTPAQLQRYFKEKIDVQFAEAGGAWWVGLPVDRISNARRYLRAHAPELEIMDGANGRPWIGGDFAWIKAAVLEKGKKGPEAKVIPLQIARGAGKDKKELFISTNGSDWWLLPPMTDAARKPMFNRWSVKNAPELHVPAGSPGMEERFKASPVGLPEDIHLGADSDDLNLDMGGVNLNPIPRLKSE